jgi:agmatine deiminase
MPAEWEKHDATWISWPYDPTTFPDRVEKAEDVYVQIICYLLKGENVNLVVRSKTVQKKVMAKLKDKSADLDRLHFHVFDYADVWFRDYGPIFVRNDQTGRIAMTKWTFNAWGGKYETLMKDDRIPHFINEKMKMDFFETGRVLEGGSIDVNGKGTLLTTEKCLLNPNRNSALGKKDIEKLLGDNLGVRRVIWLKDGIRGDDTDGHVDDIARFVNPNTVLCAFEENQEDENCAILKEDYELLSKATDQDGSLLNLIKLPMPGFVGDDEGRLPASYSNFYIGNKVVLVPVFGHANDKVALGIIGQQFPGREVVGIMCNDLVYGLGAIHCITQQQPSPIAPSPR